LSVLAATAENPDRITKLFETDIDEEEGCYVVNMTKNGEPERVIVDD